MLGVGAVAGPSLTAARAAGPTVWPNGSTTMPTVSDTFRCRETNASGDCTRFHYGTDFIGFSAVRAVSAGVVRGAGVLAAWEAGGTQVHIAHDDGYESRSLHLVTGSPTVRAGDRVTAGQVIGTMGNTGASYGVHLHLEIHAPRAVDPVPFLSSRISGSRPTIQPPTVTMDASGRISLYRLVGGDLVGCSQASAGGSFGPWQTIGSSGAGLVGQPFLLQASSGLIALYARTAAGTIVGTNQVSPGGSFLPWQTIGSGGNGIASDPFVVQMPDGRIVVYAAAHGGIISGVGQTAAGGSFGTWTMIGDSGKDLAGRPAVVVLPDGRISIYALSPSGAEIRNSTQTAAGGAFPAWGSTGTGGLGVTSEPTAVLRDGRVRVFAGAGTTVSTVAQAEAGGQFGTWVNLGSGPASLASTRPGLLTLPSGFAVYMRGQDGNAWGTSIPFSPSGPTGWAQTGHGATISTPVTPLMSAFSTIVLYAANSNGSVVGTNQSAPGSAFGSWVTLS